MLRIVISGALDIFSCDIDPFNRSFLFDNNKYSLFCLEYSLDLAIYYYIILLLRNELYFMHGSSSVGMLAFKDFYLVLAATGLCQKASPDIS